MFINAQLQTCSIQIPNSVPLTADFAAKLKEYRPFAKAVTDADGNLIDIDYDEEAAAVREAEKAEKEQEQKQKEQIRDIRRQRNKLLTAFDHYKSNLAYFGGSETDEEHAEIVQWYNTLLDITDNVTAEETPEFPDVPAGIQKYL